MWYNRIFRGESDPAFFSTGFNQAASENDNAKRSLSRCAVAGSLFGKMNRGSGRTINVAGRALLPMCVFLVRKMEADD